MNQDPLDIARVDQLARIMKENDISEIDLQGESTRVRLRRGFSGQMMPQIMTAAPQMMGQIPAAAPMSAPAESGSGKKSDAATNTLAIKSPVVGTFYPTPSPNEKPYVTVGQKVNPETIVCTIEAMKVYNEVPAGVSGTIIEVLVTAGTPVEFNQELFRVQP